MKKMNDKQQNNVKNSATNHNNGEKCNKTNGKNRTNNTKDCK